MLRNTLLFWAACAALAADASAAAVVATVSAKDSVQFAGLASPVAVPPGRVESDFYGDLTDADVIPEFLDVTVFNAALSFTAVGEWRHDPSEFYSSGPDGRADPVATYGQYLDFGVSGIVAPHNTLVGVFTSDRGPTPGAAPTTLSIGDDMTQPLLNQVFAIGSSLGNVVIPNGAARLYLGSHDSYEWTNNAGELRVEIAEVPEPAAALLAVVAACVAAPFARRRPRTVS